MEHRGIDVSAFQGFIDWPQVENSGLKFAMIRATYGISGIDARFRENMENISKTKIAAGAYHYCYAANTDEAVKEADHLVNTISSYKFHYPIAVDMEERSIANLGKQKITDIIVAFIDVLRKSNFYPMIYTTENWLRNFIDINRTLDVDIWLGQWSPAPNYTKNIGIWQHSNSGNVPGIGNNINLDISYKDYESLIESEGMNMPVGNLQPITTSMPPVGDLNLNPNPNNLPPIQDSVENEPVIYRVKPGDTLWSIAQRFLGSGHKCKDIQTFNNLSNETIHAGQTLMIPQNKSGNWTLYSVSRGDTLWNLARKFLGSWARYNEIINLNNLSNDVIYAGQILKIPSNSNSNDFYTVKPGDTLTGIAQKILGNARRYSEIVKLNSLKTTLIHPGQKLRIPA
ncbi:MAG: LysM peptidoglycan-binding domain-containing protein [Oscillospiraceae bacterium]|jgi:GH25 family lysozyme M1 (1,4-beta-N-acetylmuramidase)/LysM repeat protein|nr:LysM peptidoglycan-binding domain-containing protein [Oscillospiraceae bacterium]